MQFHIPLYASTQRLWPGTPATVSQLLVPQSFGLSVCGSSKSSMVLGWHCGTCTLHKHNIHVENSHYTSCKLQLQLRAAAVLFLPVCLLCCHYTKLRLALASFSPIFSCIFSPILLYMCVPWQTFQLTWRQTKKKKKNEKQEKKENGTQKAMTLLQLFSGASTKVFPAATQKLQTHRDGPGKKRRKGVWNGAGSGSGAGGHDGRRRRLGRVN